MKTRFGLVLCLNVCLALSAASTEKRPLRYFNIVPVRPGHIDFAVQEVKRQSKLGMKEIAVSLSYHPQCLPPENLLARHAESFRKVKAGLAGTDVKVGVLIQSTQGHSARPVDTPWQSTVLASGAKHHRICMLDPAFRAYVLDAVRSICREKPAFLLIDDDFGPRANEGFCPLHAALYNRVTGENRTGAEWSEFVQKASVDDPVRKKVEAARIAQPVAFAKEIRAAIDSVDPSMRCGFSTPGLGAGFAKETALALAGPSTRPFLRINNAVYGMKPPRILLGQQRSISRLRNLFAGIDELVAENDTWPQNYWSESARMFSTHLILGVLYGLDGGKIWMSEFDRTRDVGSQKRYEKVFSEELPKRQALYDLVRTESPVFHGMTAFVNVPERMSDSVKPQSPAYASGLDDVFAPMGFPCAYAGPDRKHPHDIYVLVKNSVERLSDEDIAKVLSHRVFVDSQGAKALVARGFGADLCAKVSDYAAGETFNREIFSDGDDLRLQSDATNVRLEAVDGAETLSRFVRLDAANGTRTVLGAGLTLGRNRRGGLVMVAGWTYDCQGWNRWNKYMRPVRKDVLVKAVDRLAGGTLPYVCVENNLAQSSYATLADGSDLVVVTNLGGDDWDELRLRRATVPGGVKRLTDDGKWEALEFDLRDGVITIKTGEVRPLVPQILRISQTTAGQRAAARVFADDICSPVAAGRIEPGLDWFEFALRPEPDSDIRCRIELPAAGKWNGELWGRGNSSYGGVFRGLRQFSREGSAAVETDLGTARFMNGEHCDDEHWSDATHKDYSWRATHLMTVYAKRAVKAYYGRTQDYAFFVGGSCGARQAFSQAMRFPEDYDGIFAYTPAAIATVSSAQAFNVYRRLHDEDGRELVNSDDLRKLADAAIDFRKERDEKPFAGYVLADPFFTDAEIDAFVAFAAERIPAFSSADMRARLKGILTGYVDSSGRRVCHGMLPGVMHGNPRGMSFRNSKLCSVNCREAMPDGKVAVRMKNIFSKYPSWDEFEEKAVRYSPDINSSATDLTPYFSRGGKLLVSCGLEDQTTPAPETVSWYEMLAKNHGGIDSLKNNCRLFVLPGVAHGGGRGRIATTGAENIHRDLLRRWVREGKAPDVYPLAWAERDMTVPVPPYPERAYQDDAGVWRRKRYRQDCVRHPHPRYLETNVDKASLK